MATELKVVQLKNIRDKVNDMPIDDIKVKELETLISKSIWNNWEDQESMIFLKADGKPLYWIQRRFKTEIIKDIGGANTKIEKIVEFSRARNDVNFVLNWILSSFKR